jgi:peptidoglycan/xylan/chitin deacetylase (PgdA/CDA1 family)
MKAFIQTSLACSIGHWLAAGGSDRVVVLCYHSVHPAKSFSLTPELLDLHLAWLKEHCEVVPFTKALEAAKSGRSRPAVAITFDDGYADNFEHAFPLLLKHGLPATFFLTVGLLEKDPEVVALFQQIRGSGYEEIRPLEWSQAQEMQQAGMECGAHTYAHPNLARLSRAEAFRELSVSRQAMEQRLGRRVSLVAYPFGLPRRSFTAETLEVAAEAGYEYGATVWYRAVRSSDHPLRIPRFGVTNDSLTMLTQKVYGCWDYLGWWQGAAPAGIAGVVSAGLSAASRWSPAVERRQA